jgi:hypothetical protein
VFVQNIIMAHNVTFFVQMDHTTQGLTSVSAIPTTMAVLVISIVMLQQLVLVTGFVKIPQVGNLEPFI